MGATTDFTVEGKTFVCHDCGTFMLLDVPASSPSSNSNYRKCSHCETLGEITIEGGEEWCGACGLDPGEELDSSDISILWKKDSGIRRIMNEEKPGLASDRAMGSFLRKFCGPHCNFAGECEQTVSNLVTCYREYKIGASENEMSRKSRKRRREERLRSTLSTYQEKPQQARLQYARAGWFERTIINGTYHTKQAGGKES